MISSDDSKILISTTHEPTEPRQQRPLTQLRNVHSVGALFNNHPHRGPNLSLLGCSRRDSSCFNMQPVAELGGLSRLESRREELNDDPDERVVASVGIEHPDAVTGPACLC